jgi:hypothetical protein
MRGVGQLRRGWQTALALTMVGALAGGCVSDGPPRLYTIPEETQQIRNNIQQIDIVEYARMGEAQRFNIRNDFIAGRMYAIDIQYTAYEAGLTKENQIVGFGAAATTIALTTASGLVAPVSTKNLLTGIAGFVTGTRAAYDNDVLLAHSIQWIQSQMRTQRSLVAERILRGIKASTADYPLATALTDLEDYYRAGTFTGGMLSTSDTLGAEARLAELAKQQRVEVTFIPTAAGRALRTCLLRQRPGVTQAEQTTRLVGLMRQPSRRSFALLLTGNAPEIAEDLLQRATLAGFCP